MIIIPNKFQHNLPQGLDYSCESTTTTTGRFYNVPGGRRYPSASSVTSLLNKGAIDEWRKRVGIQEANRISGMAARRGTDVHLACETFLRNEMTPFKMMKMLPTTKELFVQLKPCLLEHITSIYCIEQSLYSDVLRIAGKTDGAVLWDNIPTIIDFKTSTKLKKIEYLRHYCLQSTAYAIMFTERTGILIEQFALLIGVDGEREPQIFVDKIHPYIEELYKYRDEYWSLHSDTLIA